MMEVKIVNRLLWVCSWVTAGGCFLLCPLLAADLQLGKIPSLPPSDTVSESIRETLQPEGFEVTAEGRVIGEFWLRRGLPLKESAYVPLGVSFGSLAEGILIGVARFPEGWADYKSKPVPAGIYTLRYGIQPADGNHMGVSLHRDFLLLIPASEDEGPEALYSPERLIALSQKVSGTSHPSVLSLFPVEGHPASPRLAKNDLDQRVIEVNVGSLSFALVVVGKGES